MNLAYITLGLVAFHQVLASENTPLSHPPKKHGFALRSQTRSLYHFEDAIVAKDWSTAATIFEKGSDKLKRRCSEALVSKLKSTELNMLLNDGQNFNHRVWLTQAILTAAKPSNLPNIFDGLKEPIGEGIWTQIAFSKNVVRKPENFAFLLGQVPIKKVEILSTVGIGALYVSKKHSLLKPLITHLNTNNLDQIEAAVVRSAFSIATREGLQLWIDELYDHPAIDNIFYAHTLRKSYGTTKLGGYTSTFKWLLAHADENDLQKALSKSKEKTSFKNTEESDKEKDFERAISSALTGVRQGKMKGGRIVTVEGAMLAMKIFREIPEIAPLGNKDTLGGIIGSYLVGEVAWKNEMEKKSKGQ